MKHRIIDTPENICKAIDESIVGFRAYRNREILKLHYADGFTFEKIAEMKDLSDRHIRRICYENEPKIIERLKVGE